MLDGMTLDPEIHVQVMQNMLANNAIHIAQLEAGIQQLSLENSRLREMVPMDVEVQEEGQPDASTNS